MIRFESDYTQGAILPILERLMITNEEQTQGYGLDFYSQQAKEKIRQWIGQPKAEIYFVTGGTQANLIVIRSILQSYEGVISADTGHINTHETGAIEATGHKILSLESKNGKISAFQIEQLCQEHDADVNAEHTVKPGMVYLSQPTECGTLYHLDELREIKKTCQKWKLPLYIDGARLGYGLASPENDISIEEFANLCDVFYIGGTKVGALFGEAIVVSNLDYLKNFRYIIKQKGALLAKGRILGIQFDVLMDDENYLKISRNAMELAWRLKEAFVKNGITFLYPVESNQLFPILDNELIEKLKKKYMFYSWQKINANQTAIRLCVSWSTKQEEVDAFIKDLN